MNKMEKLELLNTLEVIDYDCGSGELIYVMVENKAKNRYILSKVVGNIKNYLFNYADEYGIDITLAGFEDCKAEFWSVKEGFKIYTKEELMDILEERNNEIIELKRKIRDLEKENLKKQQNKK